MHSVISTVFIRPYAAIPHLVAIGEGECNLETRLEILIFCGTVTCFGVPTTPVPSDLIESFDFAMNQMKRHSLEIMRDAAAQNLLDSYPLTYLLQATLGLQFGAIPTACFLSELDAEIETECPECESVSCVNPESISAESVDQSTRAEDLKHGVRIVTEVADDSWPVDSAVHIAAALASLMCDEPLSERILNLNSSIECASCGHQFRIIDGVQ